MKQSILKLSLALFLIAIVTNSCDQKQEYFKSESEIKKELQHSWKMIQIASTDPANRVWKFHDGTLEIYQDDQLINNGTYSVKTTWNRVYITTEGLAENTTPGVCDNQWNAKWTVITLDDGVLVMVNKRCGGLLDREFERLD